MEAGIVGAVAWLGIHGSIDSGAIWGILGMIVGSRATARGARTAQGGSMPPPAEVTCPAMQPQRLQVSIPPNPSPNLSQPPGLPHP